MCLPLRCVSARRLPLAALERFPLPLARAVRIRLPLAALERIALPLASGFAFARCRYPCLSRLSAPSLITVRAAVPSLAGVNDAPSWPPSRLPLRPGPHAVRVAALVPPAPSSA